MAFSQMAKAVAAVFHSVATQPTGPRARHPLERTQFHNLSDGIQPCSMTPSNPSSKAISKTVVRPIEIVASLDDEREVAGNGRRCWRISQRLSDKITVIEHRDATRTDAVVRADEPRPRRQRAASPACRWAMNSRRWCSRCCRSAAIRRRIEQRSSSRSAISTASISFETYFSLSCQNCPDVVQALNLMAVLNPRINHVAIDGASVPGRGRGAQGHGRADRLPERRSRSARAAWTLEQILAKLDTGASARAQSGEDQGAGSVRRAGRRRRSRPARRRRSMRRARASAPASSPNASAARCSTRWRSRTSSRFATPKARSSPPALEQHVKEYDVDIMNLQTAVELSPFAQPGGLARGRARRAARR